MISEHRTYGCTRDFGTTVYSNSGFPSPHDSRVEVYGRALKDGLWEPRKLRDRWWQFWRPIEHDEIEKHFINAMKEEKYNG